MFRQSVLIQSHTHKTKLESEPKINLSVTMAVVCCYTKNDPFSVIPNIFPPQPVINFLSVLQRKLIPVWPVFF